MDNNPTVINSVLLDGDNILTQAFHAVRSRTPHAVYQPDFFAQQVLSVIRSLRLQPTAKVYFGLKGKSWDGRVASYYAELPTRLANEGITTRVGPESMRQLLELGTSEQEAVVCSHSKAWLGHIRAGLSVYILGRKQHFTVDNFSDLVCKEEILPGPASPADFALFVVLAGTSSTKGLTGFGDSTAYKLVRALGQAGVQLKGPSQSWSDLVQDIRRHWAQLAPETQQLLLKNLAPMKELYQTRYGQTESGNADAKQAAS